MIHDKLNEWIWKMLPKRTDDEIKLNLLAIIGIQFRMFENGERCFNEKFDCIGNTDIYSKRIYLELKELITQLSIGELIKQIQIMKDRIPLEELSQIFTMNESKQKWAKHCVSNNIKIKYETEHNHNWMNANDRHLKLNIQDQMEAINQAMIQHEITISKHTILSDGLETIKTFINNNK